MPTKEQIRPAEEKVKDGFLLRQKIYIFLSNRFAYLAIGLSVIIFLAGLFFFVYPQYRRIVSENETVRKNLQIEYDAKAAYLASIIKLKKTYAQVSDRNLEKLDELVPPLGDLSELIPLMEVIALRNGAILNSVKIESTAAKTSSGARPAPADLSKSGLVGVFVSPPAGVGAIKIDVNLSNITYPVLKNVIKTIENNLRLLDISKIDYGINENKANLTIYTYYLAK